MFQSDLCCENVKLCTLLTLLYTFFSLFSLLPLCLDCQCCQLKPFSYQHGGLDLQANLLGGNPLQALGVAGPSAQQAAEVGAKMGGFFKSLW